MEEIEACLEILSCAIWDESEMHVSKLMPTQSPPAKLTGHRIFVDASGLGLLLVSVPAHGQPVRYVRALLSVLRRLLVPSFD